MPVVQHFYRRLKNIYLKDLKGVHDTWSSKFGDSSLFSIFVDP